MTRDRPILASDGNFDEVVPRGAVARAFGYSGAAIAMLAGPALIVVLALAGELAWQGVVGGMATTVLVGGFGLAEWLSIARGKRRADRLTRTGRPATALVVGARPCSIGEETGTEVTLRISGPEVPEFEVTHRGPTHRVPAVGESLAVVVDPSDGLFRILR